VLRIRRGMVGTFCGFPISFFLPPFPQVGLVHVSTVGGVSINWLVLLVSYPASGAGGDGREVPVVTCLTTGIICRWWVSYPQDVNRRSGDINQMFWCRLFGIFSAGK